MDKRAIIGIALSILVLIIYQEWITLLRPGAELGAVATPPAAVENESAKSEKPSAPARWHHPAQAGRARRSNGGTSRQEVRIETDNYIAVFTTLGGRLKASSSNITGAWQPDSPPSEMIRTETGVPLPLGVRWQNPAPFEDGALVYAVQEATRTKGDAKAVLVFQGQAPNGTVITKSFDFSGSTYPI
jgi:YidC/Oxa1 family membrane protein insertase